MAGLWNSGTVKRAWPRSNPTTRNPAAANSLATMLPTMPIPMTTASTSFRRCVTAQASSKIRRNVGMYVDVMLCVFRETQRLALEFHTVPIDGLEVVGVRAGKADHPPRRHVAVAAIDRIAEISFDGRFQQCLEEHGRGYSVEIGRAGFQRFQIGVLCLTRQGVEGGAARLELPMNGAQCRMKEFRRRERQLVSLGRSSGRPRPASVQPLPGAPCAAELPVEKVANTGVDGARSRLIRRDQTLAGGLDEEHFLGIEEQVGGLGRRGRGCSGPIG